MDRAAIIASIPSAEDLDLIAVEPAPMTTEYFTDPTSDLTTMGTFTLAVAYAKATQAEHPDAGRFASEIVRREKDVERLVEAARDALLWPMAEKQASALRAALESFE